MTRRNTFLILSAGALLAVGSLLVRLESPERVSAQTGCTAADSAGTFGVQLSGFVPTGNGDEIATFAEGGTWVADGKGTFVGASEMSVGGQFFAHTFTGTVQVNSDCTARAHVESSLGWPNLNVFWVIVKPNEEIMLTGKVPGSTVTGKAVRLGRGSQTDRIEGMLRDIGRALGLVSRAQ